jgi:hypothetical protein
MLQNGVICIVLTYVPRAVKGRDSVAIILGVLQELEQIVACDDTGRDDIN